MSSVPTDSMMAAAPRPSCGGPSGETRGHPRHKASFSAGKRERGSLMSGTRGAGRVGSPRLSRCGSGTGPNWAGNLTSHGEPRPPSREVESVSDRDERTCLEKKVECCCGSLQLSAGPL